jgi:hypothetical protein
MSRQGKQQKREDDDSESLIGILRQSLPGFPDGVLGVIRRHYGERIILELGHGEIELQLDRANPSSVRSVSVRSDLPEDIVKKRFHCAVIVDGLSDAGWDISHGPGQQHSQNDHQMTDGVQAMCDNRMTAFHRLCDRDVFFAELALATVDIVGEALVVDFRPDTGFMLKLIISKGRADLETTGINHAFVFLSTITSRWRLAQEYN